MALVLQSRVSSCPGNPLALLHSRLLSGPKEAAHTTADRAVDIAGVQVRLLVQVGECFNVPKIMKLFRSRFLLS